MCLVTIVLLGFAGCNIAGNPEAEKAAIETAEQWLRLVDDGRYAESWASSADFFRGAVDEKEWVATMQSMRKPLGKNLSREVKSSRYLTQAPGAPDGEYVVIQFKASFENKKSAVETVTPMREENGEWRVSGYYME